MTDLEFRNRHRAGIEGSKFVGQHVVVLHVLMLNEWDAHFVIRPPECRMEPDSIVLLRIPSAMLYAYVIVE